MARAKLRLANPGVLLAMTLLRQLRQSYPSSFEQSEPIGEITISNVEHRAVSHGPNYLGVSLRSASCCTDFVVADLSIVELVGRPHAAGGFVICLANTR
jgi:hypothetical protein